MQGYLDDATSSVGFQAWEAEARILNAFLLNLVPQLIP